jgi:hypothetical protein
MVSSSKKGVAVIAVGEEVKVPLGVIVALI